MEGVSVEKATSRSYEEKIRDTEANWDAIMSGGLTKKYVECFKSGGPALSACPIEEGIASCICSSADAKTSTRYINCIYLTGNYFLCLYLSYIL